MATTDFVNTLKQWDNRAAQWMGRHFYIMLFQAILAIIFILTFINALRIINISFDIPKNNTTDQLLLIQSFCAILILMVLLLIALGVLNIINNNSRLRGAIKNIEFNLSRRRNDQKPPD